MTTLTSQDLSLSRNLFSQLKRYHHTPEQGVNRLGYSKETQQAALFLCKSANEAFGAVAYKDLAGTLYLVLEPSDPSSRSKAALAMGSHIDAVPRGGQYDGMAGVIAGLQAMELIVRKKLPLRTPLVTILFPNEESNRFQFAVSSKASTGRLSLKALESQDLLGSGETLAIAMQTHHGIDIDKLSEALASASPLMPDEEMAGFVEPHIEQSNILANRAQDIGIVTNIKGTQRCGYVKFIGVADHSGACPQPERHDAILGGANFIVKLEEALLSLQKHSPDITFSFGDTRVQGGGSMNIISPNNEILFDIRCSHEKSLKDAMDAVRDIGTIVAKQRHLGFEIDEGKVLLQSPVKMDGQLISAMEKTAEELGLKHMAMPSGPGHDSTILQQSGRTSSVLFIPHGGKSHIESERMTIDAEDDPFAVNGGYASTIKMLLHYAQGKIIAPKRCGLSQPSRTSPSPFVQHLIARGAVPVFC